MKLWIAGLAAALWLFVSGALVYVVLLAHTLPPLLAEVSRGEADMRLWAVALEKLVTALSMAAVAGRLKGPRLRAGLTVGLLAVGLFMLPFALAVYANYRIPGVAAWIMAGEGSLRLVVAGLIVAAVNRPAPAAA